MRYEYRKITLTVTLFIGLFIVLGCVSNVVSSDDKRNEVFINMYPNIEMNKTIQFLPPDEEFKLDDGLLLWVKNTTENYVVFPYDMNIKIYSYDQNSNIWVDIKNTITYSSSNNPVITLSPYAPGGEAGARSESLVPVFPEMIENHPMDLRVVVLGNIKINEKDLGNLVGAYIDIVVKP